MMSRIFWMPCSGAASIAASGAWQERCGFGSKQMGLWSHPGWIDQPTVLPIRMDVSQKLTSANSGNTSALFLGMFMVSWRNPQISGMKSLNISKILASWTHWCSYMFTLQNCIFSGHYRSFSIQKHPPFLTPEMMVSRPIKRQHSWTACEFLSRSHLRSWSVVHVLLQHWSW